MLLQRTFHKRAVYFFPVTREHFPFRMLLNVKTQGEWFTEKEISNSLHMFRMRMSRCATSARCGGATVETYPETSFSSHLLCRHVEQVPLISTRLRPNPIFVFAYYFGNIEGFAVRFSRTRTHQLELRSPHLCCNISKRKEF